MGVVCAHSEHSTVIMLSDCWLKWHVSCVWYYLYMAILHAHVPSFVSNITLHGLALSHVPSFVSASHRLALDWYSIVGLSITSPGSHVPQHRWSQHHVSRLALMLALMCLAVAIHSLSHIHALRKLNPHFAQAIHGLSAQSAIHGLRKTIHGWSRSTVCAEHIYVSIWPRVAFVASMFPRTRLFNQ